MTQIHPGRFTAPGDVDVTVFLIGMRFNRPHRVDAWWPVATAMPRMLRHLAANPEVGMLGYHLWAGRTTLLLSYWRDAAALQTFAADADAPHLKPWRAFMKRIGSNGTVGIWHETYVVPAGHHEVVYVNMPAFGLAGAVGHLPVGAGTSTARQRLRAGKSRG
jgi:hypothetical protein